jgi:steroid 5-alpha reductase family enzyme
MDELDSDLEQSLKDWTDLSHEYAVSKILKKHYTTFFLFQNHSPFLICHMLYNSFQKVTFVHNFIEIFGQICFMKML